MWEAKTTVLSRTVRGMRHKHEKTGNDQRQAPALPLVRFWLIRRTSHRREVKITSPWTRSPLWSRV
jgi:hypothetical protein